MEERMPTAMHSLGYIESEHFDNPTLLSPSSLIFPLFVVIAMSILSLIAVAPAAIVAVGE